MHDQETQCPDSTCLMELLTGDLSAPDSELLTRHIASCAACALEQRALEQVLKLVAELPGAPVRPSARVLEALHQEVLAQRPWWRRGWEAIGVGLRSPIPAYRAALAGACLVLATQQVTAWLVSPAPTLPLALEPGDGDPSRNLSAQRPPTASELRPQPTWHREEAAPEVERTPIYAETIPADQFANAY